VDWGNHGALERGRGLLRALTCIALVPLTSGCATSPEAQTDALKKAAAQAAATGHVSSGALTYARETSKAADAAASVAEGAGEGVARSLLACGPAVVLCAPPMAVVGGALGYMEFKARNPPTIEPRCPPARQGDPCFAMRYLGRVERTDPIPAGTLYLAWDPKYATAAEVDAAWLVVDADASAEPGPRAFAMRTKIDCALALITFDAWTTYREWLYPAFAVYDHRLISEHVLDRPAPFEVTHPALPFVSRALCGLSESEWAQRAASRQQ
jgi:hypothetical protein